MQTEIAIYISGCSKEAKHLSIVHLSGFPVINVMGMCVNFKVKLAVGKGGNLSLKKNHTSSTSSPILKELLFSHLPLNQSFHSSIAVIWYEPKRKTHCECSCGTPSSLPSKFFRVDGRCLDESRLGAVPVLVYLLLLWYTDQNQLEEGKCLVHTFQSQSIFEGS